MATATNGHRPKWLQAQMSSAPNGCSLKFPVHGICGSLSNETSQGRLRRPAGVGDMISKAMGGGGGGGGGGGNF
ncbi:MAG TPA: hypothetical protein D7I14_05200 [Candidatus Poseidoniales archaeon]|nr:MAG TPA: hypothetical protein D7I14_05200 [Candidatus Poseidoniales archaeon]